jgi:hypothetical protein
LAKVTALDSSRIQEIIKLALDPDMVFPSYIESTQSTTSFFEYPTGSARIKCDCLIPLMFVQDDLGKQWLHMAYEKKVSLRAIAEQYRTNHKVVSRRIQSVLDTAVDVMRDQLAYYILDVYYTHFGKTRPEELRLEPVGRVGNRGS